MSSCPPGVTASCGWNWSLPLATVSWFTLIGLLHVAPPSLDFVRRMSESHTWPAGASGSGGQSSPGIVWWRSSQATYSVPSAGSTPAVGSESLRNAEFGKPSTRLMSWTVVGTDQEAPPSVDFAIRIRDIEKSSQKTYTSPGCPAVFGGATTGKQPRIVRSTPEMNCFCPQVLPPSVDFLSATARFACALSSLQQAYMFPVLPSWSGP